MRKVLFITLLSSVLFFFGRVPAQAQVCAPNRIINQFACVTQNGACNSGHYICAGVSGSGWSCGTWDTYLSSQGQACTDSKGGVGVCQSVCDSFSQTTNCNATGTITVSCNQATCQANASPTTCSGGGGGPGSCTESTSNLTYSCWTTGNSTPAPGSTPTGGWGGCGCFGSGECINKPSGIPGDITHPGSECRSDPSGQCKWDPGGCGSGGGGGCGNTGAVCSGWNDSTTCCSGLTCNQIADGSYRCGNCRSSYYIGLSCGTTPDTWCGQTYLCDNSYFACPNAAVLDVPAPPSGMVPADNAVLSGGTQVTCNAACTDDIDCGAHFVEGRFNRYGGLPTTYLYFFLDAYKDGRFTYQQDNAQVKWSHAPGVISDPAFSGGSAQDQTSEGDGFTLPTLNSSLDIITAKNARSGHLDVYVDGKKQSDNDLYSTTWNYQFPITAATGSERNFACVSNVCRLKGNTVSPTCTDSATNHKVEFVVHRLTSPAIYAAFDAVLEDGVALENTDTARVTFSGTASWALASGATIYSGGNERYAATEGNAATLYTSAGSLILVSDVGPSRGSFDVYVDGVKTQNIIFTNPTVKTKQQFPIPLPPKSLVAGNERSVKLSWGGSYNLFELNVYPQGGDCNTPGAFCGQITRNSFRYPLVPGVSTYKWKVKAINRLCSFNKKPSLDGMWSNLYTFTVDDSSTVTSTVQVDPTGNAKLVGGICQAVGPTTYTFGGTADIVKGAYAKSGAIAADGSYSIPQVAPNTGYALSITPANSLYSCTCPAGCVYNNVTVPTTNNLPFFVSPIANPWYQTVGGDIGALTSGLGFSVRNPIPISSCTAPGCTPYFSLPLVNGMPNTSGALVVQNGTQVDLKSTTTGPQDDNVAVTSRIARIVNPFVPKENYQYFYRLYSLGLPPVSDDFTGGGKNPAAATKPNGNPSNGKTAFFRNGDLTITSQWDVNANESIVIFVNGNLTIKAPIKVQAPNATQKAFLGFIVSGDINIDPAVGTSTYSAAGPGSGVVQGFYLADGAINIQSAGATGTELKFIGEGTFAAGNGVTIKRDFRNGGNGIQNNTYPVALFVYWPDLVRSVPDRMKVPMTVWKEAAP